MNASDVNKSQDFLMVESDQPQKYEQLNLYTFWKNMDKLDMSCMSPGVLLHPLSCKEAIMVLEPAATGRTAKHETQVVLVVQKGRILASINDTRSLHSDRDIIRVPPSKHCQFVMSGQLQFSSLLHSLDLPYKIRNISATEKAILYLWFDSNN